MLIKSTFPINEEALQDTSKLIQVYNIISTEVNYNQSQIKKYLKDSIHQKCRFCSKEFPEVKFSSIAHAIPEFMGNKSLFSTYECNNCNEYFGKFENEFANFLLPYNSIAGVKNKKKKIPKYKQNIEIYHPQENIIHIENINQRLDPSTKTIDLEIEIPSYIPNYLYRSLIKIGLTLIPENSFGKYKEIVTWLMDISSKTTFPPCMLFSIFPFNTPSDKIRGTILKRKKSANKEIPKTIFVLSYRNFSFQTFFPVSTFDYKSTFTPIPFIVPTPLSLNQKLATKVIHKLFDLTNKKRMKGEKVKINFEG